MAEDRWPVRKLLTMLGASGYFLGPESRILDFGCGDGRAVYAFRDVGYDAYGFDVRDDFILRKPEDREFFRHLPATSHDDFRFSAADYRLPFDDEQFDFVFSTTVLEHVQDHDAVFAELARVMKPASIALHLFPPRYIFMEPHLKVPFASVLGSYPYYLLGAVLGFRNEAQVRKRHGILKIARTNTERHQTQLNYLPNSKLLELGRKHFSKAELVPELWTEGLEDLLIRFELYKSYYSACRQAVLRLERLPTMNS